MVEPKPHPLLNKKVRILKTDNFEKVGYLRESNPNYVIIEFFKDGRFEQIAQTQIKMIAQYLDKKPNGHGGER